MRYLSVALYAEGPSDVEFLRPVLHRLCMECAAQSPENVELSDILALDDLPEHRGFARDERIVQAALAAAGAWVVLFIHADADRDERAAREERIEPARRRLQAAFDARHQSVGVVPVRMTEAWALADPDALRAAFGSTASDDWLGLADAVAHGADRLADPKRTLDAAFRVARPRRRLLSVVPYLGRIGESASLACLRRLPAFRQLDADLRDALRTLAILK